MAIAYDNRGNIFVALSAVPKIIVLRMVEAPQPPIFTYITEINTVTPNGVSFFPYGLDTDTRGNLYVVGNTDPDAEGNQVCINKYNSSFALNDSNNCSETWQGTVPSITVSEDGAELFMVRDKKWTCAGLCFWEGYPYINEYNGSNVSQNIANISVFGQDGGLYLKNNNQRGEWLLDGDCYNNAGSSSAYGPEEERDSTHYLRGVKFRRGYLFVLDYMAFPHRVCWGCKGCPVYPLCCGGCWPFDNPSDCNSCASCTIFENQLTRVLAFDMVGGEAKSYRARVVVEPNTTVMWQATLDTTTGLMFSVKPGLQTIRGISYETHGIDVDEHFNVYVALKGKNNAIVHYKLLLGTQDTTLNYDGGSYSFETINGWEPDLTDAYTARTLGSWTQPYANITDNVTMPEGVIGYQNLIKESMMSGVSCEGCSLEGAIEPAVCTSEIEKVKTNQTQNINESLASSNIIPGTPFVHFNATQPSVYRRNFVSTNITASLRFDYTFTIDKYANNVDCGGGSSALTSTTTINKQINVTKTSNNLKRLVEGGSDHFSFLRPNYPERPTTIPNTLPYLLYNYLSNRFFYKHFALMNKVSEVMGPPPTSFWNGGVLGPNTPLNYIFPWCPHFPDACTDAAGKQWMLNASFRNTIQKFENQYFGYEFIGTTPATNMFGTQSTVYGVRGDWNTTTWEWKGDPNAAGYLNPDIAPYYFHPGMIPLNNTMDWSFPFAFNFSPVILEPNPLPFRPQSSLTAPAADYSYVAITNVSILLLSILCENSAGTNVTYSATLNNVSFTKLGDCLKIYAIAASGAPREASVFIMPEGLPKYDGICFEAINGPNAALCGTTRAWFKQTIKPNTLVTYTVYQKEIAAPTRYPLIGEPDAPFPSSLMIVPVKVGGPAILTIQGLNNVTAWTNKTFNKIEGTANLVDRQLPNPLPFNISKQAIYLKSNANVSFTFMSWPPMHTPTINYGVDDGWTQIAGPGTSYNTGTMFIIYNVKCMDSLGCLLQFSNDSGSTIIGELFLSSGGVAYQTTDGTKYPLVTYTIKNQAQLAPDDPMNRNFREIIAISGKGSLGDRFKVYTDPDAILYIDNLTASSCNPCQTDADCPGGACNPVSHICSSGGTCGAALHPSGVPCVSSFVCPRIDTSLLNESLVVLSNRDHSANASTITIVGTDTTADHGLIADSAVLNGGIGSAVNLGSNSYSGVYVIDVVNAIKGETLTFRTASGTDVANFYVPTANYTAKSSIGTILPTPRTLRIHTDNPNIGRSISYRIRGTVGNTVPVDTGPISGTTSSTCTLPGPTAVNPDATLNGCEFQIDTIQDPQTAGAAFNVRIRAVSSGALPPPHPLPLPPGTMTYPTISGEEDISLCDGTTFQVSGPPDAPPNTHASCMTTTSLIPGYWTKQLDYPFTDPTKVETTSNTCGGNSWDLTGAPNGNSICIGTWCGAIGWGQTPGIIVAKSDIPLNVSKLNITIKTKIESDFCEGGSARTITVKMSDNPACETANTENDFNNMATYSYTFSPIADDNWHDNIVDIGATYQNIYCIGISEEGVCMGCAWVLNQRFYVDSIGVVKDVWVPPVIPPPPSFIAMKFSNKFDVTGFNVTAKKMTPTNLNSLTILASDDPLCLTGNVANDALPAHWKWTVSVPLQATGNWENNLLTGLGPFPGVWCVALKQTDADVKWYIDSVGVLEGAAPPCIPPCPAGQTCVNNHCVAAAPGSQCDSFNGNVHLTDISGQLCPSTAGPFFNGVWTGSVVVPIPVHSDVITVTNWPITGTSNQFDVSSLPGISLTSVDTSQAFTHVLAIEIYGDVNEHFNVTTTPLYVDNSGNYLPEQIGVIDVIPNDFAISSHLNKSGNYLFSQQDTVELDIPDNNSLGLHDFQFIFYDRFNNTFINPYTLWLRQPTAIILRIETERVPGNRWLTNVNVTAQLLYQRFDRPEEQPNIPVGGGFPMQLYVQNSSDEMYDNSGCDPLGCPIPPEDSNCSCPDWIDDPSNPGDCIPNPGCHQYGWLPNVTSDTFYTNNTGHIQTSFQIYGFGRRLMFAVFWGTRIYAPSIEIKPFYAGGMSVEMGQFAVFEPLLLITAALTLLTIKRKFNK
jgi:hypothetical protein